MLRSIGLVLVFALLLIPPDLAWGQDPALQFTIAETFPGLSGRLRVGGRLYARLKYRSDRPVRFRMEGFAAGQKISHGSSNIAPPYPAGEGEALVWISYSQPTTIDEIRIRAVDQRWQPLESISAPAQLEWNPNAARNPRPRPEWAERLSREQQQQPTQQDKEKHVGLGIAVVGIGGISILGYLVLQPLMAFWLPGGWRIAALIPLIAMVPLILHAAYAFTQGSNIWPLGLIFFTPVAFLYLVIVAAAYWLGGRKPTRI
jgi:hypothetical protein